MFSYAAYGKNNHRFIEKNHRLWYNMEDAHSLYRAERKAETMRYDFSRLGENIAALRRAAGLTQELLSDRLGVTSQAVSKWERQLSCPDVSLLPAMAEVFGVDIDALFAVSEPDAPPAIDGLPWETDGYASRSLRASDFASARSTNVPTEGRRYCSSATERDGTRCPSGW